MESLGDSLERMATCGALPYYERYFREFAMLDLDRRFGLPFESLYLQGAGTPSPTRRRRRCATARTGAGPVWRDTWRAAATSTSCPTVAGTMTSRTRRRSCRRSKPGAGRHQARPWTPAVLEPYRDVAPDCMGRWVVYWRQNMPGLDNAALDDDGRPMKNWWPFLFY